MRWTPLFLIGSALASSMPASVGQKDASVQYPSQLHGMWIPEDASCPLPGESYDGDSVMNIGPRMIQGYEDRSKPTAVARISRSPLAWRIESSMDVGPSGFYVTDDPKIFVMGEGRLTVVSSSHTEIYRKCASRGK